MLAHCGMLCIVCHKYCGAEKKCAGCFSGDDNKLEYCKKCEIKACITERGFTYCFECNHFPCKLNENLDRKYERYNWSLIMNSQDAKDSGIAYLLEHIQSYFTCSRCNGVISIQDAECSDCHAKLADMRLGPYAYFGIIDEFDEQKDYVSLENGLSFKDCLRKYHCVAVPDDIINDWWEGLTSMKSYYHQYSRPETALARWGVTLIPPD